MLIIEDMTGVTIKRRLDDTEYARIGVTQVALWKHGDRRCIRDMQKPGVEYTINECRDLLEELERLP